MDDDTFTCFSCGETMGVEAQAATNAEDACIGCAEATEDLMGEDF